MYTLTILLIYVVWNAIIFFIYGADKRKAKRGDWRISENALILCAILMGGVGALFGMSFFRHKTKHLKFKIGIPLAVIFNIAVAAAIYLFI